MFLTRCYILFSISILHVNSQDFCSKDDILCHTKSIQEKFQTISEQFSENKKLKQDVKKLAKIYSKKLKKSKTKVKKHVEFIKKNVKMENCDCIREIFVNKNSSPTKNTMCSQDVSIRGDKQKVIAFSYYGKQDSKREVEMFKNYFAGIFMNYNTIKEKYPDWTMRLYHEMEPEDPLFQNLCEFACVNPKLDLCSAKSIPALGDVRQIFPMFWRFLPTIGNFYNISSFIHR